MPVALKAMALKAVLFDAGGTLLREHPAREAIYAEAARARGLDVEAHTVRACMYRVHDELPRSLDRHFRYSHGWFEHYITRIFRRELGLGAKELPGLTAELFERFADPTTFRLFPGTWEILDDLRARGLRLGIVSNWSESLPLVLRGLGLSERVDFVLVSAIEGVEKPDPAMFERALERAGVRADEALFCGNDPSMDAEGAERAGMSAVLIEHHGARAREGRASPHVCVSSLKELHHLILERLG